MFVYEKSLQYPVRIKNTNPRLAKYISNQYGGANGELGASLRYLSQRFTMPYEELTATLTDIGNEELGHMEMVGTIIYQLTKGASPEELEKEGYADYFIDHTLAVYPSSGSGVPFNAAGIASSGDVFADLSEDMAAEQKARLTYENILRYADDPDVKDAIRFLREREIVHYQRFGECMRIAQEKLDCKNFYAVNPEYDL